MGIQWGLPGEKNYFSLHPDEPVNLLVARNISVGNGNFDPKFYNYGTLYLTLLSISNDIASSSVQGEPGRMEMVGELDRKALLYGRLINAVSGSICAVFVFLALRLRTHWGPAAIGGAMLAIAPAFVVHSRFATVDVFATMLLAASQFVALRGFSVERSAADKMKHAALAGALAGLSAGTKYNGILCLIVLFVIAYDRADLRTTFRHYGVAILCSLVAFLIATPGALLNSAQFMNDFSYEVRHASTGHGLVFEGIESGFLLHVLYLLLCLGPITFLLSLSGLVTGFVQKNRSVLAVGSFILVFYLLIGSAEVLFSRYTFPLYFGLAYGFGWLIHATSQVRIWKHVVAVGTILALGGVISGGAVTLSLWTQYMTLPDIRQTAAEFIRADSKSNPEAVVGLVSDPWFYSPLLYPGVTAPRFVPPQTRDEWMLAAQNPRVTRTLFTEPGQRFDWDVRLLDQKPLYVTYSSFESIDLHRLSNRTGLKPEVELQVGRYKAFQERLKSEYRLIFQNHDSLTGVHDLEYIRPMVWIWKRNDAP